MHALQGCLRRKLSAGLAFLVAGLALTSVEARAKDAIKLVVFGDSLTAGLGVAPQDNFPAQLQRALTANGKRIEVFNSGVSGDTTSAGLDRFDWAIPDDADAVIVELGANDALRGVDPAIAQANLSQVLDKLAARKLPVLLTGMLAPPNWGEAYATHFNAIFPELAARYKVLLYPFFLDGVVMDKTLNQPDGIHPTAKGVAAIVARITPKVDELIAKVEGIRKSQN